MDAYTVFKKTLAVNPGFRASRAEVAFAVARAARSAGDCAVAVAALKGFDRIYPGHALIPDVLLFSAQMAVELGDPIVARRIAHHLVHRYPGHDAAREARALLATLAELA